MSPAILTIKLSQHEVNFLRNADFLEPHQMDALGSAEPSDDSNAVLRLPRNLAEDFRDAFTLELAKFGFDANYDLTPEGVILEDLIDRFYVGSQEENDKKQ